MAVVKIVNRHYRVLKPGQAHLGVGVVLKEGGYDGDALLSAVELMIYLHLQCYVKGGPKPNSIFTTVYCPAHKKCEAELGRSWRRGAILAPFSDRQPD